MKLEPDHLLQAARERIIQSQTLHDGGHFAPAMYLGGVAVECLLRAYILRETRILETGHDILLLFKTSRLVRRLLDDMEKSGLTEEVQEQRLRRLEADVISVGKRWMNDFRYASEARLRAYLRRKKLHLGVKGDFLKHNSRLLVEAAGGIIKEGERTWRR